MNKEKIKALLYQLKMLNLSMDINIRKEYLKMIRELEDEIKNG